MSRLGSCNIYIHNFLNAGALPNRNVGGKMH
uniref:Uncharacterized protein n=1 Tax=Arundo donax TaxID=35708 RepID=A0A0A9HG07_ARUDO